MCTFFLAKKLENNEHTKEYGKKPKQKNQIKRRMHPENIICLQKPKGELLLKTLKEPTRICPCHLSMKEANQRNLRKKIRCELKISK